MRQLEGVNTGGLQQAARWWRRLLLFLFPAHAFVSVVVQRV
jgi:hypothetical protein